MTKRLDVGKLVWVDAADGFTIRARLFEPRGPARATIVVQGAVATPQRYYRSFARSFRDRGFRVLTFDYRGVGESAIDETPSSVTMGDWGVLDTVAVHRFVEQSFEEPTLIVGHSFGGQALGLFELPPRAIGVLLVGTQLAYVGHWPRFTALALTLLWRLWVPLITALHGGLPTWFPLGPGLPAGVARQWARWCLHPEYLLGDFPEARRRFARIGIPVLSYSFSDDRIASPRAIDALHRLLVGAPLQHITVEPDQLGVRRIGHFGFFRDSGARLWKRAEHFFERLLAGEVVVIAPESPLPSVRITAADVMADLEFGRGS